MVALSRLPTPSTGKEQPIKGNQRKLYIGIDVHSNERKVVVIPISLLDQPGAAWKKVKPLSSGG